MVVTSFLVSFIIRSATTYHMHLDAAIGSLLHGEFVLLYDSAGRENEVDMVVAAEHITAEHVARMRQHAGGLLCTAVDHAFGQRLGLRYMHRMLSDSLDADAKEMIMGLAPYGDHPTFSIAVNHYQTYTGITDRDRALTIRKMAELHDAENTRAKFISSFRTPGHVPLLMAENGLLARRRGHTELSVYLSKIAGLRPVTAICEMLDAETYSALSVAKAERYARQNAIPFVSGQGLVKYARVH